MRQYTLIPTFPTLPFTCLSDEYLFSYDLFHHLPHFSYLLLFVFVTLLAPVPDYPSYLTYTQCSGRKYSSPFPLTSQSEKPPTSSPLACPPSPEDRTQQRKKSFMCYQSIHVRTNK